MHALTSGFQPRHAPDLRSGRRLAGQEFAELDALDTCPVAAAGDLNDVGPISLAGVGWRCDRPKGRASVAARHRLHAQPHRVAQPKQVEADERVGLQLWPVTFFPGAQALNLRATFLRTTFRGFRYQLSGWDMTKFCICFSSLKVGPFGAERHPPEAKWLKLLVNATGIEPAGGRALHPLSQGSAFRTFSLCSRRNSALPGP